MKLAAMAIAAAFASGIALGLHPVVARHRPSRIFLSLSFLAVALLGSAGIVLLRFGRSLFGGRFYAYATGTAGGGWCSDVQNSFWRGGARPDGWNAAENLLLRRVSGSRKRHGIFNEGGDTKSEARRREEIGS